MLKIHPQYLSLSKLLDGRLFTIPEYQRAYSWTSHERKDLFDDLRKTHQKGKEEAHFMAAIVCLQRGKRELGTDEFHVLEIVDGQQRLTTLIILLKAISLALEDKDKAQGKVKNELQDVLVKTDSDALLLLQTNHDSSHFFSNFLRTGSAPSSGVAKTAADREILKAIEDCKEFVVKWKKTSQLLDLASLLKNRLFFLLHEIDQEKMVYTVFEVLNSRGLSVAWIDRLKSILMGIAFELEKSDNDQVIRDLHTTWRDIYGVIGLRQGLSAESLRFAATLRSKSAPSRPIGESDAVDLLRSDAMGGAAHVRRVASWLLQVTVACDAVVSRHRLNAVTRIAQARMLAVAIHLRTDLTQAEKDHLLDRWERVTFRIYGMLCKDARTRVGDYVRLAWRVVNEKIPASEIFEEIGMIGSDFPIDNAIDNLRNENCYEGWEVELRYFMFKYEEHLSKERGMKFKNDQWEKIWMASPSDSIEHILPKSKAPEKQKHRLGNLVLLPPKLNSQLQAKPAKDKADDYIQTGLLIAGKVAKSIQAKNRWTAKEIAEREEELLAWASKEWAD